MSNVRGLKKLRAVVAAGVALLVISGASYAANLMPDYSFENLDLQTITAGGTTNLGDGYMRFVNLNGHGTLQVISDAQDGNRAIKVTKTTDDLVQVDLDSNPTASWIPVQAGQTYIMSFWARTDDSTWMQLQVNWRDDWYAAGSQYPGWALTSTWTQYSCTYVAPSNADLLQLAWLVGAPGSMVIDNVSVQQVVPEPSSILAIFSALAGFAGVAGLRRK
ncbi:MAG: carbohydrate binding domain-containing protein [Armatimonadota bacterium]|nr:carbohydrate binding domain-containing protein [bacterium]